MNISQSINKIWSATLEPYWGTLGQIKLYFKDSRKKPGLEAAINKFQERWPDIKSQNTTTPIFIFSAGWRSGSTLLQRLIMSSKEVLIWGEPYSHNSLIESLAEPIKGITDVYPKENWLLENNQHNLQNIDRFFAANLYPDMSYLLDAHIAFLDNLFAKPARKMSFSRWGLKDVRLDIESAIYLKWLFPKAKFIFLYRNPYHAYASFAGSYWYKKWPNQPVYSSKHFGSNWLKLLQGYIDKHELVGGKMLSYEQLCDRNFDFDGLSDFLEIPLDKNIMKIRITGNIREEKDNYYSQKHLQVLQKQVEPLASSLGYQL